jgi:hypothetical protein
MRLERFANIATIGSFFLGLGSFFTGLFCAIVSGILLWNSSHTAATIPTQEPQLAPVGGAMLNPNTVLAGIFVMSLCVVAASLLNYIVSRQRRLAVGETVHKGVRDDSDSKPETINSLFSPLQIEAFELARDMRGFLHNLGPRPDADWPEVKDSDPDWTAKRLLERNRVQGPWVQRLMHGYAREYAPRVKTLMHLIGETGLAVSQLASYTEGASNEHHVLAVARVLDTLAVELSYQQLFFKDYEVDTAIRYEKMSSSEMGRALSNFPGLGEYVESALQEKMKRK